MRLQASAAVLTGATGGMGRAMVDALCAAGTRVLVVGRQQDMLREIRERHTPARWRARTPTCAARKTGPGWSRPPAG